MFVLIDNECLMYIKVYKKCIALQIKTADFAHFAKNMYKKSKKNAKQPFFWCVVIFFVLSFAANSCQLSTENVHQGEDIRRLRLRQNVSLSMLSVATGIDSSLLILVEKGEMSLAPAQRDRVLRYLTGG